MVIIVKPISAQLTKDKDTFGKSVPYFFIIFQDPYCVIKIGQERQRTKTHNGGGKSPQWMDTLQFQSNDNILQV